MLVLTLTKGRGVRIGDPPLSVRCRMIKPGCGATMAVGQHNSERRTVWVNEGATLPLAHGTRMTIVRASRGSHGPELRVSFSAPPKVAITRDAFSLERHMDFQRQRAS